MSKVKDIILQLSGLYKIYGKKLENEIKAGDIPNHIAFSSFFPYILYNPDNCKTMSFTLLISLKIDDCLMISVFFKKSNKN